MAGGLFALKPLTCIRQHLPVSLFACMPSKHVQLSMPHFSSCYLPSLSMTLPATRTWTALVPAVVAATRGVSYLLPHLPPPPTT